MLHAVLAASKASMYHASMNNKKSSSSTASARQASLVPLNTRATASVSRPSMKKSKVFQVLVRLPEDIATRFVQVVKPGQRNSYFLELLRRDLDRESNELARAAQALTALEEKNASLQKEDAAWLSAGLSPADDDFDVATFNRQYQTAKHARQSSNDASSASGGGSRSAAATRVTKAGAAAKAGRAAPRARRSLKAA